MFNENGAQETGGIGIRVMRLDGDRTPHPLFPKPAGELHDQLSRVSHAGPLVPILNACGAFLRCPRFESRPIMVTVTHRSSNIQEPVVKRCRRTEAAHRPQHPGGQEAPVPHRPQ